MWDLDSDSINELRNLDFLIEFAQKQEDDCELGIPKPGRISWKALDLCTYHIHTDIDCKGREMKKTKKAAEQARET